MVKIQRTKANGTQNPLLRHCTVGSGHPSAMQCKVTSSPTRAVILVLLSTLKISGGFCVLLFGITVMSAELLCFVLFVALLLAVHLQWADLVKHNPRVSVQNSPVRTTIGQLGSCNY